MSKECCGPESSTVTTLGTAPSPPADEIENDEHEELTSWWRDRHLLLPVIAGALLAAGYLAQWAGSEIVATVLHGGSLLAGVATFAPGAVRGLLGGRLGVGLLMTIAAVGAVALGRIGEAAALAFLFSIAEALEDRALDRARHGLRALLSLVPETARVLRPGGETTVPASELWMRDLLVVRPGERAATDGIVVQGRSSVDTSAVTGESIPLEVGPGDPIPAGAINGNGLLKVEATADGRDNSLTTIVRLVEEAHAKKGERARLADRIAKPLVPAVLILAALVAIVGSLFGDPETWIVRALVVLVAASPCALAIAVPVTVISAIGAASRFGVVVKSGAAFEQLGGIAVVALDKTGTLTRNQPSVVDVVTAPGRTREEVMDAAASLERSSTHPLATAIVRAATSAVEPTDVTEHPGQGITGTVNGRVVSVGSPRWLDAGLLTGEVNTQEMAGMTIVVVHIEGTVAGIVGVRDELRPEAAEAVAELHKMGLRTVMLTGDNRRTAEALAAQVGITDIRAEQRPEDKATVIAELSERSRTAMIGDGINDAPALAAAHVGIAMGATGSAAAVESADVAFTGHDLRQIPRAIAHARHGRSIMTGNIVLSLAIIVVLFPVALTGVLGLAGVVLVHELAEVVVILNGIRASRIPASARPIDASSEVRGVPAVSTTE